MLRLATAHSKLRLSKAVEPSDIDVSVELLNACIFQELNSKVKKEYIEEDDEDEDMYDIEKAEDDEFSHINSA